MSPAFDRFLYSSLYLFYSSMLSGRPRVLQFCSSAVLQFCSSAVLHILRTSSATSDCRPTICVLFDDLLELLQIDSFDLPALRTDRVLRHADSIIYSWRSAPYRAGSEYLHIASSVASAVASNNALIASVSSTSMGAGTAGVKLCVLLRGISCAVLKAKKMSPE